MAVARKYPRSATAPTRIVEIGLDGESYLVAMTRTEERRLRQTMRPYVAAARALPDTLTPAPPFRVSERLRQARVAALLGLDHVDSARQPESALDQLLHRTAEVYAKALAPQTRAAYRRRWLHFDAWCGDRDLSPLPADAGTVMLYLAAQIDADPPPSLSTLRGRVSAINRVHLELDHPPPGDDPALGMLMRGLSRTLPSRQGVEPVRALRVEELRAVCAHLHRPDPVVVRDAALLRLRLAGLSVGSLARLRWRDVRWDRDSVLFGIRSRLDAEPVEWVRVEAGEVAGTSPVAALQRWRTIATEQPPLVFTRIDRAGRRDAAGLRASGISRVLEERASSLVVQHGKHPDPMRAAADLLYEAANDVVRDRALLLVGFAGAFRRGDVTQLVWDDIRFVDDGMVIRLRRSKTDQLGVGRDVGIPWGRSLLTCPVRAMGAWRDRMEHQLREEFEGTTTCFPRIGKAGRISSETSLSNEGLTMVVKRRTEAVGLEGRWGGRSLRAGFISTAADLDLPLELIAQQSRHASLDSLVRYIRAEDLFRRNPVDRVGL